MIIKWGASVKTAVSVALLVLCVSPRAMAQAVGAIGGTITDSSGAALTGATVVLSNPGVVGVHRKRSQMAEEPTSSTGSFPAPTAFARR
jgi:hypothetical protein